MNAPQILDLVQGTDAWHQHRATALNASDAPAMMGASKYRTRAELIRERATGITPEVDAATQRLFDRGHAAEAAARKYAEASIGEDLYPVILTRDVDGLRLSASLDGQTMGGETIWEHKLFSESLAAQVLAGELEPHYYQQLEHQLLVSGAERVIFTTSDGTAENSESMEYRPVPGRAEALIAGWKQFQADVAAYVPEATPAPVVATPVEGFGALTLRVEGRVLASNLDAFCAGADAFLSRLPRASELETDQDYADAEAAVKACGEAESRIKAAKDAALAQMADVDAVLRAADAVAETIRAARLALEKVVKAEKENRRAAIVSAGVQSVLAHYTSINATLGEYGIGAPASLSSELGAAIKGKRTISSIMDAVDAAVANAKIEASQHADKVRASIVVLDEHQDALHLLPDRVALAHSLTPGVLRSVIRDRLDDARAKEAARIEAERIRAEEPAEHLPSRKGVEAARSTIKIGQINDAIAPLSITADGLAQLGFEPVGKERAAVLYDAADFDRIISAMIDWLKHVRVANRSAA